MKICLISEAKADDTHGTGVLLKRYFEGDDDYDILHIYVNETMGECPFRSVYSAPFRVVWQVVRLDHIPRMAKRHIVSLFRAMRTRSVVKKEIVQFRPELIIAVPHAIDGFRLTQRVCALSPSAPLLLMLWDLPDFEHNRKHGSFNAVLRDVLRRSTKVECVSEPLSEALVALGAKNTIVRNIFCCEVPTIARPEGRNNDLRGVILGNLYTSNIVECISAIWIRARANAPMLKELLWFCHPESLRKAGLSAKKLPRGIRFGGYIADFETRLSVLSTFDYGVIPFNISDCPESDYARYSLPSRLAEFCACGLPVFALAGQQTALAAYIKRQRIGSSHSYQHPERCANEFARFVSDVDEQEKCGRRGRHLAETEFAIEPFRRSLKDRFVRSCAKAHRFKNESGGNTNSSYER